MDAMVAAMSKSISRQEKLEELKDPYPANFPGRESIAIVLWYFNERNVVYVDSNPPTEPELFKIAGRISARRDHGNNIFFDIFDQTGSIQLHLKPLIEGTNFVTYDYYQRAMNVDLGDMVGVTGTLGSNPRGEPLLEITDFILLAKALREPPDKFHGLTNDGTRYRHRELDLMSSADAREVFIKRSQIVFEIRKWLNEQGYIEIETPVLQPIYGGATAQPFKTKHNALGQDYFLSISSELYLKRCLVGGFDRVYSISRCFRNEGISPEHNPEFTNVEIFATCEDYFSMARLTEELLRYLCQKFNVPPLETDRQMNLKASDWPLSRRYSKDLSQAWEMFVNGMEIASGASDLNNPREQESRLYGVYSPGDSDYNPYDKNYIEALEQGALPWAGVGIGIDRLCMLLLNKKNIRDVICFPLLRAISADD